MANTPSPFASQLMSPSEPYPIPPPCEPFKFVDDRPPRSKFDLIPSSLNRFGDYVDDGGPIRPLDFRSFFGDAAAAAGPSATVRFGNIVGAAAAGPSATVRFGDIVDDGVPDAVEKMNEELLVKYNQQIEESEGFEFTDFPVCPIPIIPWTRCYQFCAPTIDDLVTRALQHHEGYEEYKLVKVLIVNKECPDGFHYAWERYYITFLAKKPGEDPVTFQLRVFDIISKVTFEVFRIKGSSC